MQDNLKFLKWLITSSWTCHFTWHGPFNEAIKSRKLPKLFCRVQLHNSLSLPYTLQNVHQTKQGRQSTYNRNTVARSCNHCCSWNAISITYSECLFVALGIQQAKRMSRIVLSSVACLALVYSSTLSHKRHTFRKTLLNFLDTFSKNTRISYFMKIRSVEAELFHADGQTDMTKLTVSFHNLANAPKNVSQRTRIFKKIYLTDSVYQHRVVWWSIFFNSVKFDLPNIFNADISKVYII